MTEREKFKSITDLNYDVDDFHLLFFMWIDDIKYSVDEDMKRIFRPVMDIYDKAGDLINL